MLTAVKIKSYNRSIMRQAVYHALPGGMMSSEPLPWEKLFDRKLAENMAEAACHGREISQPPACLLSKPAGGEMNRR